MLNVKIPYYNLEALNNLRVQLHQHNFESIITIALVTCIVLLILSKILLLRNNQVYNHRINLINLISEKDIEEIKRGMPYNGSRLKMFKQVPYYKMVLKFWRPLNSFFNLDDILK